MKISKYWSLSRGLRVYNFSAQIPPLVYYYPQLRGSQGYRLFGISSVGTAEEEQYVRN